MSNGEDFRPEPGAPLVFVVGSRVRKLALSGAFPAKKVGRAWGFGPREGEGVAGRARPGGSARLGARRVRGARGWWGVKAGGSNRWPTRWP